MQLALLRDTFAHRIGVSGSPRPDKRCARIGRCAAGPPASPQRDAFERQIAVVRGSGVLGRSAALSKLFDHMARATAEGRVLREADLAYEVFGRRDLLSGDAQTRVFVHRLRRKLEAFYAAEGSHEPERLHIPVGAYRIELSSPQEATDAGLDARRGPLSALPWLLVAGLAVVAVVVSTWVWQATAEHRQLEAVVRSKFWAGLGRDRRVLLVVGDYYIFGDTEGAIMPRRMVRDFEINSAAELSAFVMANPQFQDRYVDLNTHYTPVGATLALQRVLPILQEAVGNNTRLAIVTTSQVNPAMLKGADVVYVGYFSGLGLLQDPVFRDSQFEVGATFDELIHRANRRRYVSDAAFPSQDRTNHDLGYVASFRRPSGERLVVIAGARDGAVVEMADVTASAQELAALVSHAGRFEAVFDIQGMGDTNLGHRRLSMPAPP